VRNAVPPLGDPLELLPGLAAANMAMTINLPCVRLSTPTNARSFPSLLGAVLAISRSLLAPCSITPVWSNGSPE